MNDQELRLECLKLAVSIYAGNGIDCTQEVLAIAKKMMEFIDGASQNEA